jgi:Chlorophyll A-B binding protein
MKVQTCKLTTLALLPASVTAFALSRDGIRSPTAIKSSSAGPEVPTTPLFDPLSLYPVDAPERVEGKFQPIESPVIADNTVKDPLGLYSDKTAIDSAPMSVSLPFLKRPALLDGTLPGDRGFDPFNFAYSSGALQWYRTAEVKHARLAMLAAVGWPIAELFDKQLAYAFNLKPLLVFQDRVPSVLNGGLDRTPAIYWAATLGVAFAIESFGLLKESNAEKAKVAYTPGDLGFDPLGLAGATVEDQKFKAEAELFNGRLAMLAITGFAIQEWWTQNSVINETPMFFKPINVVLEQLQDAAGNSF